METVRKTSKEKLRPTPEQEQALDVVLWRCRTLYKVALEHRKTCWERCHVWVKRSAQETELKDIREAFPEYEALHSHVVPQPRRAGRSRSPRQGVPGLLCADQAR